MTVVDIQEITGFSPVSISAEIKKIKAEDPSFNPKVSKGNKWLFTEEEGLRIIKSINKREIQKKANREIRNAKRLESKKKIQALKKQAAKKEVKNSFDVLYKVSKRVDGMWIVIHCGMTKEQADNMELELYCQGIKARVTPCIRRTA